MNPKFGCNRENNPWKYPIKKDDYMPLLEALKGFAKVYVVAPEREKEGVQFFVIGIDAFDGIFYALFCHA